MNSNCPKCGLVNGRSITHACDGTAREISKMSNTNDIKAEIAEVIKHSKRNEMCDAGEYQAAKEIMSLFEASDTTLARLAADLGVPLNVAMKFADYGKKQTMKSGYHDVDEFYKK